MAKLQNELLSVSTMQPGLQHAPKWRQLVANYQVGLLKLANEDGYVYILPIIMLLGGFGLYFAQTFFQRELAYWVGLTAWMFFLTTRVMQSYIESLVRNLSLGNATIVAFGQSIASVLGLTTLFLTRELMNFSTESTPSWSDYPILLFVTGIIGLLLFYAAMALIRSMVAVAIRFKWPLAYGVWGGIFLLIATIFALYRRICMLYC